MQFSYSYVRTQTEEIDIPDIGNFAIEAVSDKAYTYYLVIKTYDGYSQIMEYGPSMPDFDTFPSKMDVVQRWKRIDFD